MKSKIIIGLLAILGIAASIGYAGRPAQARKTVDGVYTVAQADRGARIVEDWGCRRCHGPQLEGGLDEEPQLVGEEFVTAWSGRKLEELAEKITTMPADQVPQYQIKPAAAPDVIAYLLRVNGYAPGNADLPADPSVLRAIEIVHP